MKASEDMEGYERWAQGEPGILIEHPEPGDLGFLRQMWLKAGKPDPRDFAPALRWDDLTDFVNVRERDFVSGFDTAVAPDLRVVCGADPGDGTGDDAGNGIGDGAALMLWVDQEHALPARRSGSRVDILPHCFRLSAPARGTSSGPAPRALWQKGAVDLPWEADLGRGVPRSSRPPETRLRDPEFDLRIRLEIDAAVAHAERLESSRRARGDWPWGLCRWALDRRADASSLETLSSDLAQLIAIFLDDEVELWPYARRAGPGLQGPVAMRFRSQSRSRIDQDARVRIEALFNRELQTLWPRGYLRPVGPEKPRGMTLLSTVTRRAHAQGRPGGGAHRKLELLARFGAEAIEIFEQDRATRQDHRQDQ